MAWRRRPPPDGPTVTLSATTSTISVALRTWQSRGVFAECGLLARPPGHLHRPVTRGNVVETMGLEPTTPCLQSRCSSQLSYVPGVL